ncbi:hypothetical protein Syun_014738 [Stephania yunnanensis]|uniref:Uncharacterized protein n=1 Tax=Stephania yunnanensis TaxID=152371 RepID=A0AAP0JLM2_9MAGN
MFCVMLIYIYLGGAEGLALRVAVAELARLAWGVYLVLLRLYDSDPVAPALGGLGLLGHLSIVKLSARLNLERKNTRNGAFTYSDQAGSDTVMSLARTCCWISLKSAS